MPHPFSLSRRGLLAAPLVVGATTLPVLSATQTPATTAAPVRVAIKTITVGGLDIAYREAGPRDAPVVLLLHGFPSSSHMFRDLIPLLATQYRVLAPDYPGFGSSAAPSLAEFPYTFAAIADVVDGFTQAVGAGSYVVYMQDYGGPVGFRLAVKHPERVRGFVIQNAVANVEGWNPDVVKQFASFWQNRTAATEAPLRAFLKAETTKFQYTHGATRAKRLNPDAWIHDQAGLDRPGNDLLQLQMLWTYQDNVAQYPVWQDYLKTRKPPILIAWGTNDPFFVQAGVDYFKSLVPGTEAHHFDAGHFALETHVDEIASVMLAFLGRLPPSK